MAIEETLVSVINTAVGSGKTFSYVKPEGNNACVVYNRISTKKFRSHDKTVALRRYRFQLDCYGTTQSDSRTLATSVETALEANTTSFKTSIVEDNRSEKSEETGLYRTRIDVFILD